MDYLQDCVVNYAVNATAQRHQRHKCASADRDGIHHSTADPPDDATDRDQIFRDRHPEPRPDGKEHVQPRSEEHTSELQSLMRISYAVFCLKNKPTTKS